MESPSLEAASSVFHSGPGLLPPPIVCPFEPGAADRWDRFVVEQPRATFFHLVGWKRVLEKTFGYKACYFYAEREGKITGVAPFFEISNWVVGRCLLSIPLAAYGGICTSDPESEQALLDHFKKIATAEQVDYLELRNRNGGLLPGFQPNPRYVTFSASLTADPEANFRHLPKDTRYMIRKGEKAGLQTRRGIQHLREFHGLFALSMRRLGTPVFPLTLFENLVQEFPGQTDLLLAEAGGRPVAGVFSFLFRDTILPYYAGASSEAPGLAANNFLYWQLMKSAAAAGIRCFDFGRSKKGTGSYAFKAQWNMAVETLDYQVFLVRRKTVPNFSPVNPKFDLAIRLWRHVPLWLAKRMGPRIVRWFP